MALPRFGQTKTTESSNNISTSIPKFSLEEHQRELNRDRNARERLERNYKMYKSGTVDEIKALDFDILQLASKNFFVKYENTIKDATDYIQKKLSSSNKATLISEIKKDPTNYDLVEKAYYAISSEFLSYDSSRVGNSEYLIFDDLDKKILLTMIVNEICGLGPLEPLYRNKAVREIVCNGPFDIQVEVKGAMQRVESCKFRDPDHLQELITKLYSSVNKEITRTIPIERARLHDNSRVFAVHQVVAPDGPTLNIRRHEGTWFSPDELLKYNSISKEALEWLGNHVYAGANFLVAGGTSSGKTTLLGALTGFYRNNARALTVERNIELIGCPTKMWGPPMEVVPPRPGSISSGITMRDLVEATTQMRPDIIVVGEVTDGAAFDMVQALNTGHSGACTIHANSPQDVLSRLMSLISQAELVKGKEALDLITSAFDIIIYARRFKEDGSRKIVEICEVGKEVKVREDGQPYIPITPIWKFVPEPFNKYYGTAIQGNWVKCGELSKERQEKLFLGDDSEKLDLDKLRELYL